MMKKFLLPIMISACVSIAPSVLAQNAETLSTLFKSFMSRESASTDRLLQTDIQATCTKYAEANKPMPKVVKQKIEKAVLASIPYPADGKYIGDWKAGERTAQNGRGMQFSDAVGSVNGANCYACHQLSPTEISFGNQGPSLLKYGTLRGVKDPNSKDSEAIVKYTWARLWNGHAFNACNGMPRYGDAGILTQTQLKDLMALLLEPASPVNK
jgi:L-cysteine S-thiosulfotransferase